MRLRRRCPDCREAYEQSSIVAILDARRNLMVRRMKRIIANVRWGEPTFGMADTGSND